jgi:hypothetical protein
MAMPLSSCSGKSCAGPRAMAGRKPERYWRSYVGDPLPTGAEAMDESFAAFPSWLMRINCDRCGKDRFLVESHFDRRDMLLRDIIKRMRHDGCGGRQGPVVDRHRGVSSRPVRRSRADGVRQRRYPDAAHLPRYDSRRWVFPVHLTYLLPSPASGQAGLFLEPRRADFVAWQRIGPPDATGLIHQTDNAWSFCRQCNEGITDQSLSHWRKRRAPWCLIYGQRVDGLE